MATYTLTLTPAVNRSVQTTIDVFPPKDWGQEGALDTSLKLNATTGTYTSLQRTGYIQSAQANVHNISVTTVAGTMVMTDQISRTDTAQIITTLPGISIA